MLNKKNKGNSLLIETEFGDIDLVLFENCVIITRPVNNKFRKNKNLFNFFKKIKRLHVILQKFVVWTAKYCHEGAMS
jgi:hypothetical protein